MITARSRLREAAVRHRWLTRRAATVARVGGARTIAARLERVADEVLTVPLPLTLTEGHRVAIRMRQRWGADQVVNALRDEGWKGFEHPVPSVFVAAVAHRGGTVLDIGANTGFYALVAAAAHPRATVVAFEPYGRVTASLRENVAHNPGLRTRIDVRQIAIGRAVGEATLHVPPDDHGLVETSASLNPDFKPAIDRRITVPVSTLDALHLGGVTVVKIDVESGEPAVLEGARSLLADQRPFVFYELLPGSDVATVDDVRRAADYVDVRLRPDGAVVGEPPQFDPDGWNHLLVPEEALAEAQGLLARVGLATGAEGD